MTKFDPGTTRPEEIHLVYFGHNRNDVATVRRIQSFQNIGTKVTGLTFRRDGETGEHPTDWDNIDLGYVEHAKLISRLLVLAKALSRIIGSRHILKTADIIYARNLDIFMIAWFARLLIPMRKVILVYEVLDVHESLTRNTFFSSVLRFLERRVLKHADLLVVSSPGFIENYFIPMQNYGGDTYLVENKLYFYDKVIKRPKKSDLAGKDGPIVLTWVGILRCQDSLDLLKSVAVEMEDTVQINLWGKISYFLIPDFDDQIVDIPNINYHGEYLWPDGLKDAYKHAHYVWSQELSWRGNNSDWLIPNRVYEASYFCVLSLGVRGSQTSDWIEKEGIGDVLDDDKPETLCKFLSGLSRDDLRYRQENLLNMPDDMFIETAETTNNFLSRIMKTNKTAK